MDLTALRTVIHHFPLIDNHAHNILTREAACDYAQYPFEQIVSEAQDDALPNATTTLALHRAAQQLAALYGCDPAWETVKAARDAWVQRDYDGLVRACLVGSHSLLLDDLLTDTGVERYDWHDRFTPGRTKRIVRIETLAAQTLASVASSIRGDARQQLWTAFRQGFDRRVTEAIADPAVVGFKSVICYRTGLDVRVADEDEVVLDSLVRVFAQGPEANYRVEDKPLNDWLVRQTLTLLTASKQASPPAANKPLQLHTGLGDNDIDLVRANPAYLQPLVAQFPVVDFVLLHSSYPYTRQAGYLACTYPNVYLDLGEVFPMVSRDAQETILRESLDITPTSRLLWSTDGHFFPETFYLANLQFRQALDEVFVDYVTQGDWSTAQASQAVEDILFHNSNRLYGLHESAPERPVVGLLPGPAWNPAPLGVRPRSAPRVLDGFLRFHPDVKYIWMQFLDYTATPRVRMFPLAEFARIVTGDRRIGICQCLQQMVQDDHIAPGGSTTGQFYLQPDLTTLHPNTGIKDSRSASVMTFWRRDTDNGPLPGCPRTLLQSVTERIKTRHDLTVTCGFEIEVIFLRPVPSPDDEDVISHFKPCVSNHSWSQMTTQTRALLPLLETIADTLATAGIPIEQFHAESAPGQFEFVLPPSSPLQAVDMLLRARSIVTAVAEQHGLRATLHPRPIPGAAGSAAHAHVSIAPQSQKTEDAFLAGIMKHYPALVAFTLSQDASYDRVQSGLWAGSEWVAWGTQNRETPIRKISPAHWELKSLDGLANVYLAMGAFLAAGLDGLDGELELTVKDCVYDAATISSEQRAALGITTQLPRSLEQSLAALEADQSLQEVIGEELVANYVSVKRMERSQLMEMDEPTRRKWLIERY